MYLNHQEIAQKAIQVCRTFCEKRRTWVYALLSAPIVESVHADGWCFVGLKTALEAAEGAAPRDDDFATAPI